MSRKNVLKSTCTQGFSTQFIFMWLSKTVASMWCVIIIYTCPSPGRMAQITGCATFNPGRPIRPMPIHWKKILFFNHTLETRQLRLSLLYLFDMAQITSCAAFNPGRPNRPMPIHWKKRLLFKPYIGDKTIAFIFALSFW